MSTNEKPMDLKTEGDNGKILSDYGAYSYFLSCQFEELTEKTAFLRGSQAWFVQLKPEQREAVLAFLAWYETCTIAMISEKDDQEEIH